MVSFSSRTFIVLFTLLCVSSAYGQNKVVVIPLGGDDAATTWRGSWETDTAYKKSDIVEFDGSSYIALSYHQSALANIPPDETLWDLVAASGANGAQGVPGNNGADGAQGIQGGKGDKGDTGDQGPQGDAADAVAAICSILGSLPGCDLKLVLETWIGSTPPVFYAIGDTGPAGGKVFHVTNGGLNGLEAALVDQASAPWNCFNTDVAGVDNITSERTPDSQSGAVNTPLIAVACGGAAAVAAGYVWPNGQSDGFLPNKEELDLLYDEKVAGVVGGFASTYYWSSSEYDNFAAWAQVYDVGLGFQFANNKNVTYGVRAVRAF